MLERPEITRDMNFWTEEIRKAGILDQIPHFDSLTTGKERPSQGVKPILENIKLGGKTVDIYHWGNASHRVYIHIKD